MCILAKPDTLADSLAALNDENHFLRRNLSRTEMEVEELKDQLEGTLSTRSADLLEYCDKLIFPECQQMNSTN